MNAGVTLSSPSIVKNNSFLAPRLERRRVHRIENASRPDQRKHRFDEAVPYATSIGDQSSRREDTDTRSAQTSWIFLTVSSERGPFSLSTSERILCIPSSSFTTIDRSRISLRIEPSCSSK